MLTSICWWRWGIMAPASATTVRNSSLLNEFDACCCEAPSRRSTPLARRFVAHTNGYNSQQQRCVDVGGRAWPTSRDAGRPYVLGATSQKMSSTKVSATAPQATMEFAAQAQRDEAHQHRGGDIDDGAQQENENDQTVRLREQRVREPRTAVPGVRLVPPVDSGSSS